MSWPDEPFLNLRQTATPKGTPANGGALLYVKSDGKLYTKNSSGVEALVADSASLFLAKANNLSDVANTATARSNLGAVGLTDVQTLTNKTLTAPTITDPTVTVSSKTAKFVIVCTSATRPAHAAGQEIFETDTSLTQVSDGTNWRVIPSTITSWTAVTFTNSWVDFGAPYQTVQYKKDGVRVYIRGTAKSGTVGSGTPVFTLPVGHRPPANLIFDIASAGSFGQVEISTTGAVAVTAGSNLSINLNTVSFEVV